jgi:hypothetical protein
VPLIQAANNEVGSSRERLSEVTVDKNSGRERNLWVQDSLMREASRAAKGD